MLLQLFVVNLTKSAASMSFARSRHLLYIYAVNRHGQRVYAQRGGHELHFGALLRKPCRRFDRASCNNCERAGAVILDICN
jgi:hypothetical protein